MVCTRRYLCYTRLHKTTCLLVATNDVKCPNTGHTYKTEHRTSGRSSRHSQQQYRAFLYNLPRANCPQAALTHFSSFGTGHHKLEIMDQSNLIIVLTGILGVTAISVILFSCSLVFFIIFYVRIKFGRHDDSKEDGFR